MGDKTKISWAEATLNVVTGCTRVSDGCTNCYIERTPPFRMAHRKFDGPHTGATTGVQVHPERLSIPLRWTRPRRIFVCSLADVFHDEVPDDFLVQLWETMARCPQHVFQILTKRPARMRSFLKRRHHGQSLANVWLGVSAEDQHWADVRIPILLDTPAAVRWVSAEPLLGPIDLTHMDVERHTKDMYLINALTGRNTDMGRPCPDVESLDWIVTGGESGPGARLMQPDWAKSLRDQCQQTATPFHFKQAGSILARQWGCSSTKGGDPAEWPEPFPQEYPHAS